MWRDGGRQDSVRFSLYSVLLMALIIGLGYGLTLTGLVDDLAIIRELLKLR